MYFKSFFSSGEFCRQSILGGGLKGSQIQNLPMEFH